ncbi:MAG: peptidase dimerization domain-containing protein [Proteobacteria bacterium]|nr:peptidase dimerization domain-containing protein [Pseudomonadota bacterium]
MTELDTERRGWVEAACRRLDRDRLRQLVIEMTAIPSPTGEERPLAEFLVGRLAEAGLEASYQQIDRQQGNALARRRGNGSGPDLLLYAPIDTHISGDPDEDLPWAGTELRPDMRLEPYVQDDFVIGLCAENPKGYAAAIVAAAEAINRTDLPLRGDLMVGFGSGGMPTNRRPGMDRYNAGQGNGCAFMLEQGFRGDFAVIAKGGWAVAWEEVGLCWFRIRVAGIMNYVGTRNRFDHKNPIIQAAKLIEGIERWLPQYRANNTSGLVAPEGSIGAIEGGWKYKPSFVPAHCDLYMDLRISPRTEPGDAYRQLRAAVREICADDPDLDAEVDMILSIPGGTTAPDNWIIQSAVRAWEQIEGREHVDRTNTSGATDANILRGHGIPTARIGMPTPASPLPFGNTFSMGTVEVEGMMQLARCLIHIAVDTCTRTPEEVGAN